MVVYEIRLHRNVSKALAALDARQRIRMRDKIDALRHEPRPAGVARLTGNREVYRIRVGDYRILYKVLDAELIVFVIDAGHRSVIYRS